MARLQESIGGEVHSSNVILGPVQVQGTGNIHFGRNAMIYPGVYLETQGEGRIEIGDDVSSEVASTPATVAGVSICSFSVSCSGGGDERRWFMLACTAAVKQRVSPWTAGS
jgi:acetyltransferase-like isoleucine patch superfamily enzyme